MSPGARRLTPTGCDYTRPDSYKTSQWSPLGDYGGERRNSPAHSSEASTLASSEELVQAALQQQKQQKKLDRERRRSTIAQSALLELPMTVVDHRCQVTPCGPDGGPGQSNVRVEFTMLLLELCHDKDQRFCLAGGSLGFAGLAQCALKLGGGEEITLEPVLRPLFVLAQGTVALPSKATLSLAYDHNGTRYRASLPVTLRERGSASAACALM